MKTSKEQLLADNTRLNFQNTIFMLGLNALANNETEFVGRRGDYSVSIADPSGAHGGLVIVKFAPKGQRAMTTPFYFELWKPTVDEAACHCPNDNTLALRELAEMAGRMIREAQRIAA